MVLNLECWIEIINFVLSLIMIVVGVSVLFRLEGQLKKAWYYLLATIVLFGVHEIVGILEEFGFGELELLYIITEFAYVVMFFIFIFVFKKLFDELSKRRK